MRRLVTTFLVVIVLLVVTIMTPVWGEGGLLLGAVLCGLILYEGSAK